MTRSAAEHFLERLTPLDRGSWLAAGEAAERDLVDRAGALMVLDVAITEESVRGAACDLADRILTLAFDRLDFGGPQSGERSLARRAVRTAQVAAWALLVRPLLSAEHFELLYRPFQPMIPSPPQQRAGLQ
jgi:hypothetical protein